MTQLSAADLDYMRDTLAELLPDSGTIQTVTRAANGFGGWVETWTSAGTVACRIDNQSANKSDVGDSARSFSAWMITVPFDTVISANDRINTGGQTYNVIGVSDNGSWRGVRRVSVERA